MSKTDNLAAQALALCHISMEQQLTTGEVKLATWLFAAAFQLGGFPVEFSLREIKEGCERGPIKLPGWGAHYRTVNSAVAGLQEKQIMTVTDGTRRRFGHVRKVFDPVFPYAPGA